MKKGPICKCDHNNGPMKFDSHFHLPQPRTMPSTVTATTTSAPAQATTEDVELTTAQGYDNEQIRLMEEVCIVIDENDQPLRTGTKKECTEPLRMRALTL